MNRQSVRWKLKPLVGETASGWKTWQRKLPALHPPTGQISEPDAGGVSSHRQIGSRGIQVRDHGGLAAGGKCAAAWPKR